MYVRNILQNQDYVLPIPTGLPVTLQYDQDGVLVKIYCGLDQSTKVDVTRTFLQTFLSWDSIPSKISVTGGTTLILGVIHHIDYPVCDGNYDDNILEEYSDDILSNFDNYEFYFANIQSTSLVFKGVTSIRKWADMNNLAMLPGYLITEFPDRKYFYKLFNNTNFIGQFPLVSGYLVYRKHDIVYYSSNLSSFIVKKVRRYTDQYGIIWAILDPKNIENIDSITISYADVVKFNIQPNSEVVLDSEHKIIYSFSTDTKKRPDRESTIICDQCGDMIDVTNSPVCCSNPDCRSFLFKNIERFCRGLNIPVLTHSRLTELVKDNQLSCILDLFSLPEYSNLNINVSVSDLVFYSIPFDYARNIESIEKFVSVCNNKPQTVLFYLNNTDKIKINLNMDPSIISNLIDWVNSPSHIQELGELLMLPNFKFNGELKRFDGAPIFRGKKIYITGTFDHGDHDDIISILRSYSAEIEPSYSDSVDCVLVGNIMNSVNGKAVISARERGILFNESDFFKEYEIDADLAEHL